MVAMQSNMPRTMLLSMCLPLCISAFFLDKRPKKIRSGCNPFDATQFALSQQKQTKRFKAMQPDIQEAYQNGNLTKYVNLLEKLTPQYCTRADILGTGSAINFDAMVACMHKSMGVSESCARCYPNYLQDMMGKSGMMARDSCMKKCSTMGPYTASCLARMQDPAQLSACVTPDMREETLPCLECSKSHIVRYSKCLKFGMLQPELQMNALIDAVKATSNNDEGAITILNANTDENPSKEAAKDEIKDIAKEED